MRTIAAATLAALLAVPGSVTAQVTIAPGANVVTLNQKVAVKKAAPKGVAPAAVPAAAAAATASAVTASAASPKAAAGPRECTRLPLSDIQFGRENTITVARGKLEEYAQKVAKEKGWKNGYTRSAETATCEDYLWLPIGGQEYKCLVTATFCRK